MAKFTVLCWQEIPSVVEARDGGDKHKVELDERFQKLIDMAAMRRQLAGTDQYLMEWRKEKPEEREGSAHDVAEAVAQEISDRFDEIRTAALAVKAS